ncbi:T6SS immunity protein Tli3 family protein (plasmid) [Enterobacter ludwigii]
MNSENDNKISLSLKITMFAVVVFIVLAVLSIIFLPVLQTVGASFGFGLPSGSGGRAVRDVEIDVEPQVVYRIDEHRFFTFEKYLNCNSGGFVYYNDTNKKIKKFAGVEGMDKKPQNEMSIIKQNDVLSYSGKFIYSASDNVIAYPDRDVNYKYGSSEYYINYISIDNHFKNELIKIYSSSYSLVVVYDGVIYEKSIGDKYQKHYISDGNDVGNNGGVVDSLDGVVIMASQDDHFHCDDSIKPRSVKYIKN